ncbi:peptidoglycan-binding domain-containing protein [Roseinatronobacter sp.]|uniref:peptidoglycan-binding domain-containing protein n=1 Tax=Roseinatronobacter sp. TaxID=1945755 RepID=UPI0025DE0E22|nr:peptidoglycan-binding domain-containing protein [Roseibaca sp.]
MEYRKLSTQLLTSNNRDSGIPGSRIKRREHYSAISAAEARRTGIRTHGRSLFLSVSFTAALMAGLPVSAQDDERLAAEISGIEAQIAEVDDVISQFSGGLVLSLAQARREALLLLRTVVETRREAEAAGIPADLTVPVVAPDPERAERLLGEIAAVQSRIEAAERDAAGAGGLIQAMALSRLETERLSLAQLQMAWLQAEYGIAFPNFAEPSASGTPAASPATQPDTAKVDLDDGVVAWADPNHPDIDYSIAPFELAHREGHEISGWWVIQREQAAIDDSPKITAFNYSAYDGRSFGRQSSLVARCHEGEAAVIFVQDDYLMTDFRRNTLDVTYRLDSADAVQTRWNSLTTNMGAGVFRRDAEAFIRAMHDAQSFFIRVTDNRGQRVDGTFDLAGGKTVYEAVAAACSFTTLSLTTDDYRAIQTMLNTGGFDAGIPDGVWGPGSQAAMRRFQAENDLPETSAPDRQTLEALGVGD